MKKVGEEWSRTGNSLPTTTLELSGRFRDGEHGKHTAGGAGRAVGWEQAPHL